MDDFVPAAPKAGLTDIEAARLIGRVLTNAARRLGVEHGRNIPLRTLCERIIMAAQHGGLDAESYRLAWMMRGWARDGRLARH